MNDSYCTSKYLKKANISHFKGYELNGTRKNDNYYFIILKEGGIHLEINSTNKIETVNSHEFILIPQGRLIQIRTIKPSEGICIDFNPDDGFHFFDFMMENKIPITSEYYSNLCFDDASTLHVNLISEAIMDYIHQLHDWGNAIHYSKNNTKKDVLTKLLKARVIIENEYQKQIDVQHLASSVAMSKFNFIRKFKEAFGFTPQQYIIQKRISFSQLKLRSNKTLSITDLANLSGFQNIYHFSKMFKKIVGISPSYYQIST